MSEDTSSQPPTKSLYIGNLAYRTRWYDLKDHLASLGFDKAYVDIPSFRGLAKGYAIVQFDTEEEAARALKALDQTTLDERVLYVNYDRLCRVMFKGLPYSLKWQELKDLCAEYAQVEKAVIHQDRQGRSNGLGSVYFKTQEDADACIASLNNSTLGGRQITCHMYTPNLSQNAPKRDRQGEEDGDATTANNGEKNITTSAAKKGGEKNITTSAASDDKVEA